MNSLRVVAICAILCAWPIAGCSTDPELKVDPDVTAGSAEDSGAVGDADQLPGDASRPPNDTASSEDVARGSGDTSDAEDDIWPPAPMSEDLKILAENSRYFQYRGLPMVLFGSQGTDGHGIIYRPNQLSEARIKRVAKHANHIYLTILPEDANRNTGWDGLYSKINTPHDEGEWAQLTNIARWAHENDVIVHAFPWSYKWNYTDQDWTNSDFIYPEGSSEWDKVVTNGLTKLDLHKLAIDRIVAATWDYPNVVYNFMWEYVVRRSSDPDGSFHRWWVDRVKEKGHAINPDVTHLFSIKFGREHPSQGNADFIVEEDGNGFWYNHPHSRVLAYEVPLVFISSDLPFADNTFTGWDDVPHSPRTREHGQNRVYNITPGDVQAMITAGFHPAETWHNATSNTLRYYLQARWYMENLAWGSEQQGFEGLPDFKPSERPELANPEGFEDGRRGTEYAVLYTHPDGLPPAQAEVWIDVNEDGRFAPNPSDGERFEMQAEGSDYEAGVLFTVSAPANKRYVFRFADENWNPPLVGGLVPGESEGISYSHWGG
ncbi:MAG: hypothetical protein ACNA8W_05370 [Bradymonadaceae bacterium]